ncbi:MAG: flagellar assembly protein FliW [Anaerovoracaceae bacterium]
MEINTKDFGIVQVEDDAIYQFDDGLYGFEDVKRFAIFAQTFDDVSFLYLQAIDETSPSFLVFEPWEMHPDYQPSLTDEDMRLCQVEDIEQLIFLVIANIPSSIDEMSINIKSPVVLNPKTRKGRQVILQNPDYTIRYQPFFRDGKAGE